MERGVSNAALAVWGARLDFRERERSMTSEPGLELSLDQFDLVFPPHSPQWPLFRAGLEPPAPTLLL